LVALVAVVSRGLTSQSFASLHPRRRRDHHAVKALTQSIQLLPPERGRFSKFLDFRIGEKPTSFVGEQQQIDLIEQNLHHVGRLAHRADQARPPL
jgi:hypothetical protein